MKWFENAEDRGSRRMDFYWHFIIRHLRWKTLFCESQKQFSFAILCVERFAIFYLIQNNFDTAFIYLCVEN